MIFLSIYLDPRHRMRSATVHITGMSCGHCLHALQRALQSLKGVRLDSLQIGRAELAYDEATVEPAAIEAAIEEAGYSAVVQSAPSAASGKM
jgi:copper chaperone CopZ